MLFLSEVVYLLVSFSSLLTCVSNAFFIFSKWFSLKRVSSCSDSLCTSPISPFRDLILLDAYVSLSLSESLNYLISLFLD